MNHLAKKLTHMVQRGAGGLAAVAAILMLVLGVGVGRAQCGAGSIQGTVIDSTGAVIAHVRIYVANVATNLAADASSDAVGFYPVPGLFTGTYAMTVGAPSMKTYSTQLQLLVAQSANINPVLTAGEVTQRVEVTADMVQLTTGDSGTIAPTLESSRIKQLPMKGRILVSLAGQTTPGLEGAGTRANGRMGEALEYLADGVPLSNRQFGCVNLSQTQLPDPDAVQEVRTETTNTGAQYLEPATGIISRHQHARWRLD